MRMLENVNMEELHICNKNNLCSDFTVRETLGLALEPLDHYRIEIERKDVEELKRVAGTIAEIILWISRKSIEEALKIVQRSLKVNISIEDVAVIYTVSLKRLLKNELLTFWRADTPIEQYIFNEVIPKTLMNMNTYAKYVDIVRETLLVARRTFRNVVEMLNIRDRVKILSTTFHTLVRIDQYTYDMIKLAFRLTDASFNGRHLCIGSTRPELLGTSMMLFGKDLIDIYIHSIKYINGRTLITCSLMSHVTVL